MKRSWILWLVVFAAAAPAAERVVMFEQFTSTT
jgi:hypothetical protein